MRFSIVTTKVIWVHTSPRMACNSTQRACPFTSISQCYLSGDSDLSSSCPNGHSYGSDQLVIAYLYQQPWPGCNRKKQERCHVDGHGHSCRRSDQRVGCLIVVRLVEECISASRWESLVDSSAIIWNIRGQNIRYGLVLQEHGEGCKSWSYCQRWSRDHQTHCALKRVRSPVDLRIAPLTWTRITLFNVRLGTMVRKSKACKPYQLW